MSGQVEFLTAWGSAFWPLTFIPAVADQRSPAQAPAFCSDGVECLNERARAAQIEADQRHPSTGRVHMRIDECGSDDRSSEIDHTINTLSIRRSRLTLTEPRDLAVNEQQGISERVAWRMDWAAGEQNAGHERCLPRISR